ncbi:hypothetical protein [Neobacillus mesonae]|uniref:hypothetical protein n=1 Tax=Neobacillus mesonae TaxID=1193713 RepID=UPI00203F162E|nr:hypothetical protein [Neobacillus mesonae]MCM3569034.1 hypothetical protein [Neobacillus mesonae]
MAAITRFYDFYRPDLGNEPDRLRIYPDYFIFHVGKRHMNLYWMDIWPLHKEVVVEDDPERILEAINDRAITRLIVEDGEAAPANFLRETFSSAHHRIVSALAYSPFGRAAHGDIMIASCSKVEEYVQSTIELTEDLSDIEKREMAWRRHSLMQNNRVIESYRRLDVSDAIQRLGSTNEQKTIKNQLSINL